MLAANKSDEELPEYFKFEKASYPMSIFKDGIIHRTLKSALFELF